MPPFNGRAKTEESLRCATDGLIGGNPGTSGTLTPVPSPGGRGWSGLTPHAGVEWVQSAPWTASLRSRGLACHASAPNVPASALSVLEQAVTDRDRTQPLRKLIR